MRFQPAAVARAQGVIKKERIFSLPLSLSLFLVDPPGLEPGLCGTKIRRVANYTMGQFMLQN